MENKKLQRLYLLQNRLSINLLKIIKSFLLFPFLIILITRLEYWVALIIVLISNVIYSKIKKVYENR